MAEYPEWDVCPASVGRVYFILMDQHRDTFLPQRFGHADMLWICVGDYHRFNIGQFSLERVETFLQETPVVRQPGVNHREANLVLNEIPIR
jgi:hypothetical protein